MRARHWIISLLLFLSIDAFAAGRYLFDILTEPRYMTAWSSMIATRSDVDEWLQKYSSTMNGVSAPSESVQVHGRTFEVGNVCKPHDCGDNQFYVAFAPDGKQAWGVLLKADAEPLLFGEPDADVQQALKQAAGFEW